jgi:signal transduction histidine kinase
VKKIILLYFLIFASLYSFAQNERIFYEKVLDTAITVSAKQAALDSLLVFSWKERDFDSFTLHTETFMELAKSKQDYEQMAKKAMNAQFPLTNFKNNPEKAIELIERVLPFENELEDSFLKGGLYLKKGAAYLRLDLQKAASDFTMAIDRFQPKDSIYLADAYLFRGRAYSGLGLFVQASDDYKKAYDIFESNNDLEYMLHARSGEIIMYSKNGFLEKAIEQRERLIQDLLSRELYQYISLQMYNQTLDYKKLEKHQMRYDMLNEAMAYADSSSNKQFTLVALHSSLSDYYSGIKHSKRAIEQLKMAEKYLAEIPNDIYANSIYLMALIHIQMNAKNWVEAKENALKRLDLLDRIGIDEETINTHLALYEIYKALNKNQESYFHFKKHATLKDSIYSQSKTNALVYYQTLYETERKEKEILEKEAGIILLEEKNLSLKKQYFFGGVALTFAFVMFFLYKNQRNLKQKKELNEKYTQDLLLAQEEERKRVSKDLHDSVGQSLLLLKNKIVLQNDDATKALVESAIEEVRSISRDLHPFQLQEMGITKAIENILYQVDETTELFISKEITPIDGLLNIEKEVNVYRIVQESFNNILKHANATAVKFKMYASKNDIVIQIQDNGVGFDFSKQIRKFESLGLKTLKERTRFLKGTMKVESQSGKGSFLEFKIPKGEK